METYEKLFLANLLEAIAGGIVCDGLSNASSHMYSHMEPEECDEMVKKFQEWEGENRDPDFPPLVIAYIQDWKCLRYFVDKLREKTTNEETDDYQEHLPPEMQE